MGSTMRQEQEPATEEITEVGAGVLRLQLPISMPGLGHVNCYALEDERGVALVDPGLPGPDSYRALTARLAHAGFPLARVHTVIVTHSHPDHFGGAGRLRDETGAEVVGHRSFRTWWDPAEPADVDVEAAADKFGRSTPWDEQGYGDEWRRPVGHDEPAGAAGAHVHAEAIRPPGRRRRDPPRRTGLGRRPHTRAHPRPPLPVRPGRGHPALGRPRPAHHHAPHLRDGHQRRPAGAVLRLARPHARPGGRHHRPPGPRPPLRRAATGRVEAIKVHHEERLELLRKASIQLGRPATVRELSTHLFSQRAWGPMAETRPTPTSSTCAWPATPRSPRSTAGWSTSSMRSSRSSSPLSAALRSAPHRGAAEV